MSVKTRPSVRREARYTTHMRVEVRSDAELSPAQTIDVSAKGVGIVSPERLRVYSLVDLVLKRPPEEPLALTGMVTNETETDNGDYRHGVNLHFFGDFDARPWERLVESAMVRERLASGPHSGANLGRSLLWQAENYEN